MGTVTADRVKETSTTTGTGNFTLAGAVTNFRTFNAAFGTNKNFYGAIIDDSNNAWEVGIYYLTSSTSLVRATIIASSNSNAIVNFGAGTKTVIATITSSSSDLLLPDDSYNTIPTIPLLSRKVDGTPIWSRPGKFSFIDWSIEGPTGNNRHNSGSGASINPHIHNGKYGFFIRLNAASTKASHVLSNHQGISGYSGQLALANKTIFTATLVLADSLYSAGDAYGVWLGIMSAYTYGAWSSSSGVAFIYDPASFSGSHTFRAVCRSSGSQTSVDTGITAVVGTEYRMAIYYESASSVKFYINDVIVATITTNIPATSTSLLSPAALMEKSAGSTQQRIYVVETLYGRDQT